MNTRRRCREGNITVAAERLNVSRHARENSSFPQVGQYPAGTKRGRGRTQLDPLTSPLSRLQLYPVDGIANGGETGSTGVKKLTLHAEVPTPRKTVGPKHKRRRLRVRCSRLSGYRSPGHLPRGRTERRLSGMVLGGSPALPEMRFSRLASEKPCPQGVQEGEKTKTRAKHVET